MSPFVRDPDEMPDFVPPRLGSLAPRKIAGIAAVVAVGLLLAASIAYVPAGHVGVLTLFGRVTEQVLPEGTHIVNPLKQVFRMSVRTQELQETATVPSNEGLIVTLDTSLLFRLDPQRAFDAFRTIGPNYIEVVVVPNLRSAIREVTASNSANALYTGQREEVAQRIAEGLRQELEPRGITIESVLLREVQLPQMLKQAIEAKQQAEQEALRMNFVLQREQQEAERKRIEAAGIADFQRIVAQGISQQLLTWKGIEATEKLAASNNSKVVVIGSGNSGLPIILGNQ
jgi:regulator of protease activity HflC (stomatin/prohibitin superfamily)